MSYAKAHHTEGGDESLFDRLLRVMDEKTTARKETKPRARAKTRDKYDRMRVFPISRLARLRGERHHSSDGVVMPMRPD
jgi:hypothetical protein